MKERETARSSLDAAVVLFSVYHLSAVPTEPVTRSLHCGQGTCICLNAVLAQVASVHLCFSLLNTSRKLISCHPWCSELVI